MILMVNAKEMPEQFEGLPRDQQLMHEWITDALHRLRQTGSVTP